MVARILVLVSAVGLLLVSPPAAHATVYSWKDANGVRMLSNDPGDVPEDQRAQTYTAKPAPARPQNMDADDGDAYQRGFDAGLQAADREVTLASELARSMLDAVPATQPAPIIIEQSAPAAPDYASYYPPPYGGGYGSYPFPYMSPYSFFPSAFTVGFIPRHHFFPGHDHFTRFVPNSRFGPGWGGHMR